MFLCESGRGKEKKSSRVWYGSASEVLLGAWMNQQVVRTVGWREEAWGQAIRNGYLFESGYLEHLNLYVWCLRLGPDFMQAKLDFSH